MVSWNEFENRAPEMAQAGLKLLYQFGVGLAFLATVRRDGGPRLHPICPTVVGGNLYSLLLPSSPKCGDLKRDGRYALHTFPPVENDDEFLVMGRAYFIDDRAREALVRADQVARGMTSAEDEALFRFDIDRVMHAKYPGGHGDMASEVHSVEGVPITYALHYDAGAPRGHPEPIGSSATLGEAAHHAPCRRSARHHHRRAYVRTYGLGRRIGFRRIPVRASWCFAQSTQMSGTASLRKRWGEAVAVDG